MPTASPFHITARERMCAQTETEHLPPQELLGATRTRKHAHTGAHVTLNLQGTSPHTSSSLHGVDAAADDARTETPTCTHVRARCALLLPGVPVDMRAHVHTGPPSIPGRLPELRTRAWCVCWQIACLGACPCIWATCKSRLGNSRSRGCKRGQDEAGVAHARHGAQGPCPARIHLAVSG